MKGIWIITKKELTTFFDSLAAYVLLVIFLGVSGFFTWISMTDIFLIKQVTLQPLFGIAYWALFIFTPALTMRMLSEEKRTGTIELLETKSISDWQIVAGKALACELLIIIAFLFTIPYYITLTRLGDVDHGAILCGYLGLILMSAAYIGIGMFASSISNNQIVSFLISLLIGVFFLIIFDVLSKSVGVLAGVFDYLSFSSHFESISRGVIDTTDVIYFLLITVVGLVLAEATLSRRSVIK